ncbi:MAG: hypothetical protein ACOC7M_00235 [Chloroflexota bacterium]
MHAVILAIALVAGVFALEMQRAVICIVAITAAVGAFAVAMAVAGALEVAVGAALAAVVVALLFRWAFKRTGGDDVVARLPQGAPAALGVVTIAAFLVIAFVVLSQSVGTAPAAPATVEAGAGIGLLREGAVIVAAAAGIWAMLRGTGRRDE